MAEEELGIMTHYFGHINVGAIEIKNGTLKIGDTIHIKGVTTDFTQKVDSMQVEHKPIEEAKVGDSVGLKLSDKARVGDKVFKVFE